MAALEIRMQHVIFELRPVRSQPGQPDENVVVIRGDLILTLDKPKIVQDVTVKLSNHYSLTMHKEAHQRSGVLFEQAQSLLSDSQLLEGQNHLQFKFILPSTTAPYERCSYGSVQMKLKAKVKFPGFLAKDTVFSRKLYLFYIAADKGSIPDSLALRSEQYNEHLGPFLLQGESSEGMLVAGLVNFRFAFLHPPQDVIIDFLSGAISQNFHLKDPKRPEEGVYDAPPQILTLFHLNGRNRSEAAAFGDTTQLSLQPIAPYDPEAPFARLKAGQEDGCSLLVQLPNDDYLRGTSSPLSETPIHSTHELIVTIRYRTSPSSHPQEVQLKKALTIAHCHCVSDNMLLPEYSHYDANPLSAEFVAFTRSDSFAARHSDCQCSRSAEMQLARAKALGLDKVYTMTPLVELPGLPPKT